MAAEALRDTQEANVRPAPGTDPGDRGPGDRRQGNLPAAVTTLLEREALLQDLARALGRSRLVTLAGPPGIGKSRLGVEVAHRAAAEHPGGAWLVELAPVQDGGLVPAALAASLSVSEEPGRSLIDSLVARLRGRHMLIVLDNCEHVVGACAGLADALLRGCPDLRIVATSREPFAIEAEVVWQVPPLSVPEGGRHTSPDLLMDYEAVQLFVERARAVEPGFTLNAYVAPAVAEICCQLDGIPLAIEFAAARVELLTPAEIARRLDHRFELLTTKSPDGLPHHRTLLAALEWSHDLLSAPEQALLARLSVFSGGFDLEAAEGIVPEGDRATVEVAALLAGLVSKSLVAMSSPNRYALLDTIRAFGAARLEQRGEGSQFREAHARFYLSLAEGAQLERPGPAQEQWLDRLQADRANLRASLEWSLGHGRSAWALRLTGALIFFWRARCQFNEGRELLEAALAISDGSAPVPEAKALWGLGFLALMAGDRERAMPALERSLACFCELGDLQGQARALLMLGSCEQDARGADVLALVSESGALAREVGDSWCLALALVVTGYEHVLLRAFATARPHFSEAIDLAREAADRQALCIGLGALGMVTYHQGDLRSAEHALQEAIEVAAELGDSYAEAQALLYLGGVAAQRSELAWARECFDGAISRLRLTRPGDLALSLVGRARVARAEGDRALARSLLEEAYALARRRRHDPSATLLGLGELAAEEQDPRSARRFFEEALDRSRSTGTAQHAALALYMLGELARADGDVKRASLLHGEALELRRQTGHPGEMLQSLDALATISAANGRREHAARLYGATSALREAHGFPRSPDDLARHAAGQELSSEEIRAASDAGAALSLEQAAAEAAKGRPVGERPTDGWASLTESEHHVAALVAEGLSNREIGERLFTSHATVKKHLLRIFVKLGVTRRTELAREVWRRRGSPETPKPGSEPSSPVG